jgi:glycine cleavage system H protein
MNPDDLLYSKEHEWIRMDQDTAAIGITSYAAQELGEVVYVELPEVGSQFDANDVFGTVESVKAVSELFMPVSGEVLEVNESLSDSPELVNEDVYGKGWMIQIRMKNRSESDKLLSAEEYEEYTSDDASSEEV